MIPDLDLELLKSIKELEKELKDRSLSEAGEDLQDIRRKIIEGIIEAEISLRMIDLNKED